MQASTTSALPAADGYPSQDVRIPTASETVDLPSTPSSITNTAMAPVSTRANPEPEITEDNPRRQTSFLASAGKTYPAPVAYDDCGPYDDPALYGAAPWFDKTAVLDGTIVPRYASNGFLPGGIPLSAMGTESWRRQFCCYDNDLRVGHGRTVAGVRVDFAKAAYAGLNRFLTFTPLPEDLRADAFLYRTQGEIEYVNNIDRISAALLEGWRGELMVSNRAMLFTKPCVKAEFRYFRKNSAYWKVQVRDERRFRSTYGMAVPYQSMTHHHLRPNSRDNGWVSLVKNWGRVEVPRGCFVELPPCFSYVWSEMHNDP